MEYLMEPHPYKNLGGDEIDAILSGFLIDSWSYSKVSAFARNEKAFEMNYVFGVYPKSSSTTIAGTAYHHALWYYFQNKKEGRTVDLPELEQSAFSYIEEVKSNVWKLQKTTPTVEECKIKATKTVVDLLRNFIKEVGVYESELKEVIDVELYIDEFLTINGADIPIPCHLKIDLVIRTNDDKIVIIDHKSKAVYTSDDEIALVTGRQAITYVKGFEAKSGLKIDEVWFVENKYSTNKDGSPQLNCFKITVTDDTRKLYEALLYEPLKRMLQAVSDPDYVYLINDSDNLTDKAELYDFWARTMICEVEDFNVEESKKELVSKRLKKIRDASINTITPKVIKEFKNNAAAFIQYDLSKTDMTTEQKIEHALRTFGTIVRVAHKFEGYSSNTYLLDISAGVQVKSIYSKRLDIANALDVPNVRISNQLVVYENKSYLGIDFPKKREKDLLWDAAELEGMKIPVGKDNFNKTVFWDLENHSTPHVLVCGATGSGKSVFIRSTTDYAKKAGIKNIIIFDPKFEFTKYNNGKNVLVFNDIIDIEEQMAKLVEYMNELVKSSKKEMTLVVFDEFADAVAQSRKGTELDIKEMVQVGNYAPKTGMFGMKVPGDPKMKMQKVGQHKSLEENLKIILQKGRSSGFRVVAATQRASVKVITGDAKVNFPVQICFRVPKEVDSKVVLDEGGAEALAGLGDGIIKSPEYADTIRFQGFYKP